MPLRQAHFGNTDCIDALTAAGATLSCADVDGHTALVHATLHGRTECVAALARAGPAVGRALAHGARQLLSRAAVMSRLSDNTPPS